MYISFSIVIQKIQCFSLISVVPVWNNPWKGFKLLRSSRKSNKMWIPSEEIDSRSSGGKILKLRNITWHEESLICLLLIQENVPKLCVSDFIVRELYIRTDLVWQDRFLGIKWAEVMSNHPQMGWNIITYRWTKKVITHRWVGEYCLNLALIEGLSDSGTWRDLWDGWTESKVLTIHGKSMSKETYFLLPKWRSPQTVQYFQYKEIWCY